MTLPRASRATGISAHGPEKRWPRLRDQIPAGAARDRLDAAVLACEFGYQRLMMAVEEHGALDDGPALASYLAADRATVEAVDALRARIRTAGADAG